jgi:catechol 2,3-dioxygenase-like lactoylglutathione lyase family enzyme
MADFKRVVPVPKVSDMRKSVDFYTGVLGFSLAWRAANDGGENCMLQAGATAPLLSTGPHLGDRLQFTGTLYFNMAGVQEFFERVKGRAVTPYPPATRPAAFPIRRGPPA